jgi:KAP family P-loop domain
LLLAALAAVLLLLATDRSLIPGWLHWLSAGLVTTARSKTLAMTLTGIFPLVALGLVVLVANPVYTWLPPLGWLIPPLAAAAAILLVIDLPKDLNHAHSVPLDLWVRVPVAVFLAILLAKVLLLHRHATRARSQESNKPPPLLPSQEKALTELGKLITDQYLGRVLPLEGRLGEGKSFLVRRLRYDWSGERDRPVVVVVDVWQQQTETDLQAAILEALYCHPAYLARLGWLQAPATFLFARWIAAVRGWNSTLELRVRQSKVGLQVDLDIPGLRWQSHFERATARMVRAGRSTVMVLDEIDRATPSVTQAALTLARRSVDVPGVTVLIPYIRSLIRYKAFNPLQPTLPDLSSSMDAILYEERFAARSANALGGDPMDPIRKALDDLRSQTTDQAGDTAPTAPGDQLTQSLRLGVFANAEGLFRERLQERFEEKYLGAAALQLHPPDARDMADMVVNFGGLRRQVDALLSPQADGWEESFRGAVQGGLSTWQDSHGELVGPPLRVLEGALYRILQQAVFMARGRQLAPEDIATLAVAAYDAAGLVHGSTGEHID